MSLLFSRLSPSSSLSISSYDLYFKGYLTFRKPQSFNLPPGWDQQPKITSIKTHSPRSHCVTKPGWCRGKGSRLLCTRCPRHHPHDAFPAQPSSQPRNPPPSSVSEASPAPLRCSAPLPAGEEPCSFPSSLTSGELLAFPFASRVIYRAVRQRQLTDIRQVEMPPPACTRALDCQHQGAKFHCCWDI